MGRWLLDSVHPPSPKPRWATALQFVIPRGCDFLIFVLFGTLNQNVFQNSHKAVILSEAPRGSTAKQRVSGAESKDPENDYWPMLFRAFRPPKLERTQKSHRLRPKRSRIAYSTTPPNATNLDRKFGVA